MTTIPPRTSATDDVEAFRVALGEWNSGEGPLYLRLADAITHAITLRRLQPGDRLPAERQLAAELIVGRNTVIRASEVLRERGLLESRRGSGSWIAASAASLALTQQTLDGLSAAAPVAEQVIIDLATASLAADPALLDEVMGLGQSAAERILDGVGYSDAGLAEFREAIADSYTRDGLPTVPSQILVTTGAQQSLSLIVRRFLSTGDVVVVEEPTSAGALDLFSESQAVVRSANAHLALSADDVLDTLQRSRASMVYVTIPGGVHGMEIPRAHLETLADGVSRHHAVVVEDASARDLALDVVPHLASLTDAPVLSIGSMSKLYWGGLRIGWVRGPEPLIEGLTRTKARADLGTSILPQHLGLRLLGRREEIRARRLAQLAANLDLARAQLDGPLSELEWTPPRVGPAIWARLPYGTSTRFVEHAHGYGVRVAAGAAFSSSGHSNDRLRISLAPSGEILQEGLRRLAEAWRTFPDAVDAPSRTTQLDTRRSIT